MEGLNGVLILGGIAALLTGLLSLKRGLGLARRLRALEPPCDDEAVALPPVSVLAPCRGLDSHFEAYARALLSQEYSRYEVLFLVESTVDPAWEVLSRLLAATPKAPAALLTTGPAEGCGQKTHNLLGGLDHIDPHTTILAFVDSDVQVHPHWLKALVAPLSDPSIGATSGFRWYVPPSRSVSGSLRSAWNAATLALMVHARYGFAWGGSTAIRCDLFEKLRIREAWSRGLSDDWLLTRAVQAAGLLIRFVPACLVPTYERCTWRQLVDWTTRQATITRVYAPQTWRAVLLLHGTYLILGVLGLIAAITSRWGAVGLLLSHWILSGASSMVVCRAALCQLGAYRFAIAQRAWAQALWTPAVTVLSLLNLTMSLTTHTIRWRGITYTMLSPQRVVAHRDPPLCALSHRERAGVRGVSWQGTVDPPGSGDQEGVLRRTRS